MLSGNPKGYGRIIMEKEQLNQLLQQLKKQQKKLRPYFSGQNTDCYRIIDGNVDGMPLQIDRYGDSLHISISETKEGTGEIFSENDIAQIAGALYIQKEKVVIKTREKLQEHQQYTTLNDKNHISTVHENGLNFRVNLLDYIDTGLFLDHRKTRQMVREECFGKSVLNLFSYTGSFSVYAASGGAAEITTVDLSSTYLEWAKENFKINDFLPGTFEFIQSDVSPFLIKAKENHRKWDLIILDPPTFSNSRKMDDVWDIQKDHYDMIELCSTLLRKDGVILFSTNYRQFSLESFRLTRNHDVKEITSQTRDEDFGKKKGHRCWRISRQKEGQLNSSKHSQAGGRKKPSSGRNKRPSSGSQRKTRG
ncbi:MAG: hypothetical protein B6241_14085 [Spirochaetaceae bacterium 4572_59]|nr:MAG: hypothetical protein B6241_14085 [Spirochaetaceae bacterium 4572_59]